MKIFILAVILFSSSSHAFNWTRCQSSTPVDGSGGGAFEMTSTTVLNTMVQSSQVTSFWGDCSLLGEAVKVRKTFIAQNLPWLMRDMAKGSGEYLEAYASLHHCNEEGRSAFGREMKKRYFHINEQDFESVFRELEEGFTVLRSSCPLT